MDPEPMKFHEAHGSNIELSENRAVARKFRRGGNDICFTHRPLAPGEKLVSSFVAQDHDSWFAVGLTRWDPHSLRRTFPHRLDQGLDQETALWGSACWIPRGEFLIYKEETTNRVMMKYIDCGPAEIISGFTSEEPVYIVFGLLGANLELSMTSRFNPQSPRAPTILEVIPSRIRSKTFENLSLQPAYLSPSALSRVQVLANCAVSHDPSPSSGNFAFVETPLKPGSALVVQLNALKRMKPVRMIVTVKNAHYAFSCGDLPALCATTYSNAIESETPEAGDELAVRFSSSGAVYTSHNNREWIERVHIDPDWEYHVIFSMEHISVLTVIGTAAYSDEVGAKPPRVPRVFPQDGGKAVSCECVICLENMSNVVVMPCSHMILCEGCALRLQTSQATECPMCRTRITKFQKMLPP